MVCFSTAYYGIIWHRIVSYPIVTLYFSTCCNFDAIGKSCPLVPCTVLYSRLQFDSVPLFPYLISLILSLFSPLLSSPLFSSLIMAILISCLLLPSSAIYLYFICHRHHHHHHHHHHHRPLYLHHHPLFYPRSWMLGFPS
jgi:hypothetical protein